MDELHDDAKSRANNAQLTRVMSEQIISRRHSSDSPHHKHDSKKSGKESRDDGKSAKKSHQHRSSNDGAVNGSPVNGVKRQGSKDNIERKSSSPSLMVDSSVPKVNGSSPVKPLRRADSLKDVSLATANRESPTRLPARGYEFSLTSSQKKFINETIPKLRENDPNITAVITKGNLPSENFGDFAISMVTNKKVNTLNMSECLYAVPVSVHVAKILHENRAIQELNANGNALRTEGIKKIAPELSINKVLIRLFLRNNLIDDEGAASIFANLQDNATLQVIDLGKNELSHQCLPTLVTSMKINNTLQELVLDGTSIADDGMKLLSEAFAPTHNISLKTLSLQDAKIGSKGFAEFTAAMRTHKSLSKLLLRGNKVKVDRVTAENLFKMASLQDLDLSANLLCEDGVTMLAQGFSNNTSLLQLNLSETLPTTTTIEPINAMRSLAEVLGKNRTLHTLMLAKNGLQDESVEVLMAALIPGKSALHAIDLSSNRITNKGAEYIARMLSINTQLHEIDLSANKIMLEGANAIINALKQNRALRKFIFINSSIEPALPQAASEMLKQNFVIQKCLLQKKDEKKISSRLKKEIKIQLAYNKKMNFYSYSVKHSRLFQKLSILQEIKATDYADFQQAIADYFSQTRKIMRFLDKKRASENLNKQQVVKEIVKDDLTRIFKLLNETSDIFKVYTEVTEKLQMTYEKLIRDVPAMAPVKPITFPKPPAPTLVPTVAASDMNNSQALLHSIQPPPNVVKQAEQTVAIPSQTGSGTFALLATNVEPLSFAVSPRAPSASSQLLLNMDSLRSVDEPQAVEAVVTVLPVVDSQNSEIYQHENAVAPLATLAPEDRVDCHLESNAILPAEPNPIDLSATSAIKGNQLPLKNLAAILSELDGDDVDTKTVERRALDDRSNTHDSDSHLPLTRYEQQNCSEINPVAPSAAIGVTISERVTAVLSNEQEAASTAASPNNSLNNDSDSDNSDSSTSSSSAGSPDDASDISIVSALDDRSASGSRLSSGSVIRHTFQRPDYALVPPLSIPDSDEDISDRQGPNVVRKSKSDTLAFSIKSRSTKKSASPSGSSVNAPSSVFFKPDLQKEKKKLQDEAQLDLLKDIAVDLLVRYLGLLMANIVQINVTINLITPEDRLFLRKFEEQLGVFLCKLFDEFKGHEVPVVKIQAFIMKHKNFKLSDEHIGELVNIIEIINAQRFSILSPQGKQLLNKIFTPEIIECLKVEDEEDLETVQSKGEKEDDYAREPRPRLVFFNYLKTIIFDHTMLIFTKCQWASSGKAEPIQVKTEPPKEAGCAIC